MLWTDQGGGLRRATTLGLLSLAVACSATPRSSSAGPISPNELGTILYEASHSCPNWRPRSQLADQPPKDILVEVTLLDAPLAAALRVQQQDLPRLAQLPEIRLLGTPHLTGKFDLPATMTLERHFGELDEATFTRLSIVPRRSDGERLVIELELGFLLPNSDPTENPSPTSTSWAVEAGYGEPTLRVAKHPGNPKRGLVVVVKAYPMWSSDDLRTLFECKMRVHQLAIEQR